MTIDISAVPRRAQFTGSAGTGPYSFTFEILLATDIAVYKNATLLTLTTDYTVTINGDGTGSVTLVSAATGSDTITIVGSRDIARTTDFVTGGDFLANSLNDELDSQTIFAQQLEEQINRTFRLAPYSNLTAISTDLPAPSALKAIRWNATADALENTTYNLDDYTGDAAASASAAAASALAASGSETDAAASAAAALGSEQAAATILGGVEAMGLRFNFDSATTMADPGAGDFRMNSATMGSVTAIAVSANSAATGAPDVSAFVSTWADSTNTVKGHIVARKASDPATFAVFSISAVTDNTTWLQITASVVDSGGTWTNGDAAFLAFTRAGNKGTDGAGSGDFLANGTVPMSGNLQLAAGVNIVFEGTTADAYETTITAGEPTADRTITLPNASGTVVIDSDISTMLVDADLGVTVQAYDANTAKLNSDQSWSGSQRATPVTDNDGSFDMNAGNDFLCTPTGTITLVFTNYVQGQRGCIYINNTSNYTIGLTASRLLGPSGLATTLSATGKYWLSYWCVDATSSAEVVLVTATPALS